jgi:hypothetical protein
MCILRNISTQCFIIDEINNSKVAMCISRNISTQYLIIDVINNSKVAVCILRIISTQCLIIDEINSVICSFFYHCLTSSREVFFK